MFGKLPALRMTSTWPLEWLNELAFSSTARMLVKPVQSPTTTTSVLPSESNETRRHGVGSLQFGAASASEA